MANRGRQQKIFDEKNDPEIVKVADRYIELRKEEKSTKEKLKVQEKNLIGLMQKATKNTLQHQGYTISITTADVVKMKVKEPKVFD
jgi:hypothetical protein